MRRIIFTLSLLMLTRLITVGQTTDQFLGSCNSVVGTDAKYLKDFRVKLGKTASQNDLRYKANMSLWKNTKYRFSMCNTDDSQGQLILSIKDDTNKTVLSSFDPKTGKAYPLVDFVCSKSGIYQLSYDFSEGQQGSALGVVCVVK
jgi:hypothetical protein